jgi:hypothetical protein
MELNKIWDRLALIKSISPHLFSASVRWYGKSTGRPHQSGGHVKIDAGLHRPPHSHSIVPGGLLVTS